MTPVFTFWLGVYVGGAIYHTSFVLLMAERDVRLIVLVKHALVWPWFLMKRVRERW